MSDAYRNFEDLAEHQTEGRDFQIERQSRDSDVLFVAPHGGGIEPGTTPLAKAAAGPDHSYYCFNGIKKKRGNWCLHLTSTRFDEPRALEAVEEATHVIAIHGASDRNDRWVMVGGLDDELAGRVRAELETKGIEVRPCTDNLAARSAANICNKGRKAAGVQLELSRALRDQFKEDSQAKQNFVEALRAAVPQERVDSARHQL